MTIAETYRLSPRRILEPGARFRVAGERGVYTFRSVSVSSDGAVSLRCYGPGGFRAFRPERVTKIEGAVCGK